MIKSVCRAGIMGYAVPAKLIVFALKVRYCSIQTDNCFLKVVIISLLLSAQRAVYKSRR